MIPPPYANEFLANAGWAGARIEPLAGMPRVSVLQKPFALATMLEEIRRVLRRQLAVAAQLPVWSASS